MALANYKRLAGLTRGCRQNVSVGRLFGFVDGRDTHPTLHRRARYRQPNDFCTVAPKVPRTLLEYQTLE